MSHAAELLPPIQIKLAGPPPTLTTMLLPSTTGVSCTRPTSSGVSESELLSDPAVRKALALLVDRAAVGAASAG